MGFQKFFLFLIPTIIEKAWMAKLEMASCFIFIFLLVHCERIRSHFVLRIIEIVQIYLKHTNTGAVIQCPFRLFELGKQNILNPAASEIKFSTNPRWYITSIVSRRRQLLGIDLAPSFGARRRPVWWPTSDKNKKKQEYIEIKETGKKFTN